jgi:hypothetical protein
MKIFKSGKLHDTSLLVVDADLLAVESLGPDVIL